MVSSEVNIRLDARDLHVLHEILASSDIYARCVPAISFNLRRRC